MPEQDGLNSRWSNPFQPRHFRLLVFASFILTSAMVGYLVVNPTILEYDVIKSLILVLFSLYITLMFFILWPHDATLDRVPYLESTVKIAGPIVLWIVIFTILDNVISDGNSQGRLIEVQKMDPNLAIPFHYTELISDQISRDDYIMIEDRELRSHLRAIYVKFPPGVEQIDAVLQFNRYKPYHVVLSRKSNILKIEKLEKYE